VIGLSSLAGDTGRALGSTEGVVQATVDRDGRPGLLRGGDSLRRRPVLASAPAARRDRALLVAALIGTFLVFFLGLQVAPSFASEHTEITAEYGKEGAPTTGLGQGCHIAYDGASERLYFAGGESLLYGLGISSPTATPLGGNFPIQTGTRTECGDPQIAVNTSGTGNIYVVASSGAIYGFNSNGAPLGGNWPVSIPGGGETCGVDVTGNGEVWGGNYSQQKIFKYTASGEPNGTINLGFSVCKFVINRQNGDVFVPVYGGGPIWKYTASSGYSERIQFPEAGAGEPGLAVNGAEDKLYVGNGTEHVTVYDTETAAIVETIALPQSGGNGLAVDEGTDTLFATVGSGETGRIVEWLGVTTPKAITGEPIGNSEVSGTANPNGVGPITECYFEYALATTSGWEHKVNCDESTPITTEESVHANLTGLIGEETYRYRLVVSNGQPHGTGRGAAKTITPHNVKGLKTEAASNVTASSAVLNASFAGNGEDTQYFFEWGQSKQYGHVTPVRDAGSPSAQTHISEEVTGLKPGVLYHFRVVAENGIGPSKAGDVVFTTFELPSVESFTTSNLSESTAEVKATINPHGFETKYWVEYGPTLSYGSTAPIPPGTLGAVNTSQAVSIQLGGLERIVYHFRVVAESVWGRTVTNDQTFNFYPPPCPNAIVRQQTNSQYLADCRAYELVSPAEMGGVSLTNAPWAPDPYATSPARFAFGGYLGALPGTDASNSLSPDTYIATRTNTGWESHYTGVPGSLALGDSSPIPNPDFSKFFDFLEGEGFEGVKQPNDRIPYIWDSEGHLIERWPSNFAGIPNSLNNEGAFQPSPDLTHLAFSSVNSNFTPGTDEEGSTTPPGSAYDYDVATHVTKLISLDEQGHPITLPSTNTGTNQMIFFPGTEPRLTFDTLEPKRFTPDYWNPAVSTDGSHILMAVWARPKHSELFEAEPPMVLYMRVNDAVSYDVSQDHAVNYLGMSSDGTKVYFDSTERLTSEDTDESLDIYMWSQATNELTLVSAGPEGIGNAGNADDCEASSFTTKCNIVPVQTAPISDNAIAEETGEIYFYSPEQLEGSKGIPNQENLYVYREGKPQFVASLTPKPIEHLSNEYGPLTRIQVSPEGKHAAFITSSKLTSYDNNGIEEMYTYEPATEKLRCSSCVPNGEKPHYDVKGSQAGLFMSNDGRTFFQTQDALVQQDTNEEPDVYEFVDGRPQLISTGTGTHEESIIEFGGSGNVAEEGLSGVSANGVNVYFAAREELVPQDKNGEFLVFYDARVGGGFPYEPPLAPCEAADECHGPGSSAPGEPGVASQTNMGSRGNAPNPPKKKAKSCKKGFVKKNGKCIKKSKSKKHRAAKENRPRSAEENKGSHRNA
jgi:hypothetical protein